ncbi:Disease resistance protein RPM1 [Euphorbia peplus]|nr:Disease resistance protein RPM1 [Euphorbia peplus]
MAESLVSFLLEKIDAILKEETDLLKGVKDEIESIKYELDHMKAFLRVAESMEERDPQSQVWIKQVRDIAFDIEDVIDEFTFQLAGDQRDSLKGYISKIKNVSYRHKIASKLRNIKSRIDSVSSAHQRYKTDVQEQQGSGFIAASDGRLWVDRRNEALLLQESDDLVGTDNPKRQLIQWLVDGAVDLSVISVVGMGGLGKTSLVKQVYDDSRVIKHFNNHVRIVVSQSFKIEDLLKDMIRQINEESNRLTPPQIETMSSPSLKATVKNLLQENRYLLVLDDVWHVDFWDAIKPALPRKENGSRVMITTRSQEVGHAPLIAFKGQVFNLQPLSFESSWSLFCKIAFQSHDCPPHLADIARNIIEKCKGLPLAVVTISAVLAKKVRSKVHEWEMVKSDLGGEFESIRKIWLISYYDLPFYLKACFLYFSIFPEDYEIDRMMLIRLWIAEGFVEEKGGKTVEEVAESYLDELLNRSLIQVASMDLDGMIISYRVHDLLREVVLTKSKEQDFVRIYNGRSTRQQECVRRVAVHDSLGDIQVKQRLSRLRSLIVFRVIDPPLELLGNNLKLIKVLDLSGTELDVFPEQILKLYQLRYLSLKNTLVSVLPASIHRLQNLETLDLEGTYVTNLPTTIVKLRLLRHLIVFHYEYTFDNTSRKSCGFKAISGIGLLRCLQHLSYVDLHEGKSVIQELGMLIQLRLLWIGNLRKEDGTLLSSSIDKLADLRNLSIRSINEQETIDLQGVTKPPKFLERLYLEGGLERVPHWISSLSNLSKLCFRSSKLKGDILKPIQALPNLVTLVLENAFDGEELYFETKGFEKLKFLWLKELPEVRQVEIEKGAMPSLVRLSIVRCKMMEKVPNGIEHIEKLQRLVLADVSEKLIRSIYESQNCEDCWRVKHIPNIDLSYFKDTEWVSYHL